MGLVCQGWNIDRYARIENFIVTFDKPSGLSTDIEESMLRQTLRIKSDNQHRKRHNKCWLTHIFHKTLECHNII